VPPQHAGSAWRSPSRLAWDDGGDSDGGDGGRNYSLTALVKQQRLADKAARKAAAAAAKGKAAPQLHQGPISLAAPADGGGFAFNAADPRFAAALADPAFAIDPTASQFRATPGTSALLQRKAAGAAGPGDRGTAVAALQPAASAASARPMVVTSAGGSGSGGGKGTDASGSGAADVIALAEAVKGKFAAARGGTAGSGGAATRNRRS
jgi:hypothetical protein